MRNYVDRSHLDDEDGIGDLASVINTIARHEVFFLSDSDQSGEIAGDYVSKQIFLIRSALFIKDYPPIPFGPLVLPMVIRVARNLF